MKPKLPPVAHDARLAKTIQKKMEREERSMTAVYNFCTALYLITHKGYQRIKLQESAKKHKVPLGIFKIMVGMRILKQSGGERSVCLYWVGEKPSEELAKRIYNAIQNPAPGVLPIQTSRNLVPLHKEPVVVAEQQELAVAEQQELAVEESYDKFLQRIYKKRTFLLSEIEGKSEVIKALIDLGYVRESNDESLNQYHWVGDPPDDVLVSILEETSDANKPPVILTPQTKHNAEAEAFLVVINQYKEKLVNAKIVLNNKVKILPEFIECQSLERTIENLEQTYQSTFGQTFSIELPPAKSTTVVATEEQTPYAVFILDVLREKEIIKSGELLAMFMKKFKEEKSQWSFYHTLRDLRNKNKIIKNKRFYRIA
jgi:hypothetical protein